jgi:hypothetical protein
VQIYDGLDYRHWDTWNEGKFNHVLYKETNEDAVGTDIMGNEKFDSPQKPFGGDEDYLWSPDSKKILYVSKKRQELHMPFRLTPFFEYLETGLTTNRTEVNPGYDVVQFSIWQPNMVADETGRYEADKMILLILMA